MQRLLLAPRRPKLPKGKAVCFLHGQSALPRANPRQMAVVISPPPLVLPRQSDPQEK